MKQNALIAIASLLLTVTLACSGETQTSNSLSGSADAILQTLPPAAQLAYTNITKSKYYGRSTYQDCVVNIPYSPDAPFVLSPRRQTDTLTRQLYTLLPAEARDTWAYVIPDRIVQNPAKYLPYLAQEGRRKGYIVGTIAGSSSVSPCRTNEQELLVLTYKLLRSIGYPTKDIRILYSKGDSPSYTASMALSGREAESRALNAALAAAEADLQLADKGAVPQVRITWGADELAMLAFANVLIPKKLAVIVSNPSAPQHYEAGQPISKIIQEKAIDADLTIVSESESPDLTLVVNSGGVPESWDPVRGLPSAVYVDRRSMANGAKDAEWSPTKRCDGLAYGAWGTSANAIGSAIASAKIIQMTRSEPVRKRLFMEAVAHDLFFIGYSERPKLQSALSKFGIQYTYDSRSRIPQGSISTAFNVASALVKSSMAKQFEGTSCFVDTDLVITSQINRFFEADMFIPYSGAEQL